jgi:pimeloyl-ACP methyl ester carboxylesterase
LVGYSGGGAVAALVAARRNDVSSLRTLAGYMDHVSLNREVGVTPLKGSLDPIKAAPRLRLIPQIHFSGKKDKVIPKWVAKRFSRAVGNKNCTFVRLVNATHEKGWERVWQNIGSKIPACR